MAVGVGEVSSVAFGQARGVFWGGFVGVGWVLLGGRGRFDYLGDVFEKGWSRFYRGRFGGRVRLRLSCWCLDETQNFGFYRVPWEIFTSVIALEPGLRRRLCRVGSRRYFGLPTQPGVPDRIMLRVQPWPFILIFRAQLDWRLFVDFFTLISLRGISRILRRRFMAYYIIFTLLMLFWSDLLFWLTLYRILLFDIFHVIF